MTELGKQVWDKMEEMGWQNAPEGFHLEYYENIIECTKQALTIPVVVGQSELLKAFLDYVDSRYSEQGTRDKIVDEFLSL